MPVGFQALPPMTDGVPDAPWALEFSRFVGVGGTAGAHDASKGRDITVVHTDTGYTKHPELMQNGNVLEGYARTTVTDHGPSIQGAVLITAGMTEPIEDDGIDPLGPVPYLPFNPCHGTSTGSVIMSPVGFPNTAFPEYYKDALPHSKKAQEGRLPQPITGAAPEAMLLPIRVSDTVIIDSTVAANLTDGIDHAVDLAMKDSIIGPTIGVISISMGWPFAGRPQDFTSLRKKIQAACDEGIIVCAAAVQFLPYTNLLMDRYADFMDRINDAAESVGDTASDLSSIATLTGVMARLTGLALSNQPTLVDLADEIRQKALTAGRSADEIARYMTLLQELTESSAEIARWVGGPGYPGTDPNTICCAACDINGFEMKDGFYGPQVDITAPGVNMYSAKASRGSNGENDYYTHYSSGTSYSTAITAGACALWQAHHGREYLLATYGAPMMVHLFRWALKHSAAKTTPQLEDEKIDWDSERRGYGILNAEALLDQDLPDDVNTLMTHLRNENMITIIQENELWKKLETPLSN